MEKSVVSAIEKIKLQEQDKEAKLKEKRELDAALVTLHRAIRDAQGHAEKAKLEQHELLQKTSRLRARLEVEKIRRDALKLQLDASTKTLNELRAKSDQGVSEVWELRSSLSKAVQNVSDECDIWALLIKPTCSESVARPITMLSEDPPTVLVNEARLKEALDRKERARVERDRLKAEPDVGEEFVRKFLRHRSRRSFSSNAEPNENAPIKFSTSPAARKTISPVLNKAPKSDMPWYQPYSVLGSLTVFMVYFFILREESDIDLEFTKTLYERIKGMEKAQLLQCYKFNKENGYSVAEIEQRLRELEIEEAKALA